MSPSQKLGMLIPRKPMDDPILSSQLLGLAPARAPSCSAIEIEMIIAAMASSNVAGIRLAITATTGSPYL